MIIPVPTIFSFLDVEVIGLRCPVRASTRKEQLARAESDLKSDGRN